MMQAIVQAAADFEEHGFVVMRQWLDAASIACLSREVSRIHARWLAEDEAAFIEQGLVNMHSLTNPRYFDDREQRRRFFELVLPHRLTSLVEGMFGEGIYFHNTQLFFNPHNSAQQPYWHRDLQYSPLDDAAQAAELGRMLSLHIRIPLLPEQGIDVIPGTHKRWDTALETAVRKELDGHVNSEELPGALRIALEPGDVLVFDAQMLHRGHYASNRERMALDVCAGRAHPFTSPYLDGDNLPDDDEIAHIRNNHWYVRAKHLVTACRCSDASTGTELNRAPD